MNSLSTATINHEAIIFLEKAYKKRQDPAKIVYALLRNFYK